MAIDLPNVETTYPTLPCANVTDAAAIVKKNLQADRDSIDLSNQLNVTSMYSSACSGISKDDYPSDVSGSIPSITNIRRTPLPHELVEQFSHMQCNCVIGVFPQIGRAWLTVDSDIFVWRYADGEDLAYFDGLAETILSVSLVQPKPGIFREHIKYLLVLTTALDIVLLGVSFTDDDVNNEMHLLPDPLFTLSSDGSYLLHSVGTGAGRIFCGGKDGCLYEIVYYASSGWFSRKCSKINHSRSKLSFLLPSVVNVWLSEEDSIAQLAVDDTRNILYTRSEKGAIAVYDLGKDGLGLSYVTHVRLDAIQRRAREIVSTIAPSNLNEIIYIAPITRRESRHLQLVAVTQAGVRLYFMTHNNYATSSFSVGISPSPNPQPRPTGLHLVHVRLPPFFTSSSIQRTTSVHSAHHNNGTLLLASRNGDDGILWCTNRDTFAFEKTLKETQVSFALDGQSWAISEVPSPLSPLALAALPSGSEPALPPDPPVHITQHIQKPPEYVVITSQGCHIFNKLRPVDQLRYILERTTEPDSDLVQGFFKIYKNGEAICCCVIIAMTSLATDQHIAERAVAVFLHFGGLANPRPPAGNPASSPPGFMAPMSPIATGTQQQQPQMSMMRTPGGLPVISTPMPGTQGGMHPIPTPHYPPSTQPMSTTTTGQQQTTTGAVFGVTELSYYSERQHGVYKMFSRIMRPLWEGRLVEDFTLAEGGKQRKFVVSRLDEEMIGIVLENLTSFRNFVVKYCLSQVPVRDSHHSMHDRSSRFAPMYGRSDHGVSVHQEMHRRSLADAVAAELMSMQFLSELVQRSVQVLGLWRLLLHHQIHVLYESLDKPHQISLKSIVFQDLVLGGENLCGALISTLVTKYIDDHSTVDALSAQLREVCPSLYSLDDAVCSKASELLGAARTSSATQRQELLQEASHLFKQIAHSVNLPLVVQQFQAVRSYTGAVDLCLSAALKRDEEGLALKLYHSPHAANDPEVDPDFRKAYLARQECYKCIIEMLEELMAAGQSHPAAPSVPTQPGPPKSTPSQDGLGVFSAPLQPEEAQQFAESCLQRALASSDELLHVTIYEWMIGKGLTGQLLRVSSPFVEPFLRQVAASQDENPSVIGATGSDLLWQYYERCGQHSEAAKILANLAEKPGTDRDLSKRIEHLSRAKINARSVTSVTADQGSTGGQLLHELEEKMEVAEIQLQTLQQLQYLHHDEAAARLNSQLVDVTILYREFAEPYQLAECKLAIVHCAGLHDPSLVEALWQNIIEHELSKPGSNNSNQPSIVRHKIVELGRRYVTTRRYFPLDFLVTFLEKISCGRGWDLSCTFSTMLEIGVPISELLAQYGSIHAQKLPCWGSFGNPHHMICVINEMLSVFLDDPLKYVQSGQQRRTLLNRSLDSLALHLVELRSVTSPNEQLRHLIAQLRRSQASLEAMQERGPG